MKILLSNIGEDLNFSPMMGISVMPTPHVHAKYELYFCPENIRQKSVINGVEYEYKFPCAILSHPYTVHSMSCLETENTEFERYAFYFNGDVIKKLCGEQLSERILPDDCGLLFKLSPDVARELHGIVKLVQASKFDYSVEESEMLFSFFMMRLFSCCDESDITRVGKKTFYIQDVLRYVFENISESLDVSDIAHRFAVSRSKIDRDFRDATGYTVHDFIENCRLNQAMSLLREDNGCSVKEIAKRCGFKSETYFFPFFKKKVGVSPSEYKSIFKDENYNCGECN